MKLCARTVICKFCESKVKRLIAQNRRFRFKLEFKAERVYLKMVQHNRRKPVHDGHLIEFNAEPRWCKQSALKHIRPDPARPVVVNIKSSNRVHGTAPPCCTCRVNSTWCLMLVTEYGNLVNSRV